MLGLSDHSDTLSHWIAHYLAELFIAEEAATGAAKVKLGKKITETTLLLWKNREHLPPLADPMARYAKAVDALAALDMRLVAETSWARFLPKKPMPAELEFYEKSARLGMLGALEMIPDAGEDLPAWLPELIDSKEADFTTTLGQAYAHIFSGHGDEDTVAVPAKHDLSTMRTALLDELQALLDNMRAA